MAKIKIEDLAQSAHADLSETQLAHVLGGGIPDGTSNTAMFSTAFGTKTLAGDYNGNGAVDGRDFLVWQRNLG